MPFFRKTARQYGPYGNRMETWSAPLPSTTSYFLRASWLRPCLPILKTFGTEGKTSDFRIPWTSSQASAYSSRTGKADDAFGKTRNKPMFPKDRTDRKFGRSLRATPMGISASSRRISPNTKAYPPSATNLPSDLFFGKIPRIFPLATEGKCRSSRPY